MVNQGAPLPEEAAFAGSAEDGFDGEGCVFEVSKRTFGEAMWDMELEKWACTVARRVKPWWKVWSCT